MDKMNIVPHREWLLQKIKAHDLNVDDVMGLAFFFVQKKDFFVSPSPLKKKLEDLVAKGHFSPFQKESLLLSLDEENHAEPLMCRKWFCSYIDASSDADRSSVFQNALLHQVKSIFEQVKRIKPKAVLLPISEEDFKPLFKGQSQSQAHQLGEIKQFIVDLVSLFKGIEAIPFIYSASEGHKDFIYSLNIAYELSKNSKITFEI